MMFLLFVPASRKWLGRRKDRKPLWTALVDFVTFIVQTYFNTLLHYVLYAEVVLKVMGQKTLVKCR